MEPLACSTGCSKDYASLADGQMEWTALRKRPDGTTFVQGTKWKKVNS